jgi:aryl carrier-like protein
MFMSSTPHPAEPDTAADARAQRAQRRLDAVDQLIEIGLDMVRLVQSQAKVEVEAAARFNEPAPDFTLAFERVSRTVRRAILLGYRLDQPEKAAAAAAPDRVAVRKKIIRAVEDSIGRDAAADDADSLRAEFVERLDSPDLEDEIGDRPAEEIIAEIRRDLGLTGQSGARPWERRTPKDITLLCARAAEGPRASARPAVVPMPGGWTGGDPRLNGVLPPWQGGTRIRSP